MKTVQELYSELKTFESQFAREIIPAGTPDKKRLQREADERRAARSSSPENVAVRLAIMAEIKKVKRSEAAKSRAKSPDAVIRRLIFKYLRKMGFKREHVSGRSAYYTMLAGMTMISVRVSDHHVPMNSERQWNADNGGATWADSEMSFVVEDHTSSIDALRWLVAVRKDVRNAAA